MTTNRALERRVQRLENDSEAIYELISGHGERLARVERTLDEHTQRFDGIDGRLDGIDGRLDGIDGQLDGMDGQLAEILRRLPEPPTA